MHGKSERGQIGWYKWGGQGLGSSFQAVSQSLKFFILHSSATSESRLTVITGQGRRIVSQEFAGEFRGSLPRNDSLLFWPVELTHFQSGAQFDHKQVIKAVMPCAQKGNKIGEYLTNPTTCALLFIFACYIFLLYFTHFLSSLFKVFKIYMMSLLFK